MGSRHEDDDDGAAVDGAVVSWAEGAGCPLPNWKDPAVGWVAQVEHVPVARTFWLLDACWHKGFD